MILVIGGAYQGKQAYAMKEVIKDVITKIGYLHDIDLDSVSGTIIIRSLEKSVQNKKDYEKAKKQIEKLLELEEQNKIKVILIGELIGNGIVPIEASHREWRDQLGFFYQYLAKNATEVYRVWAGLGEKLKG